MKSLRVLTAGLLVLLAACTALLAPRRITISEAEIARHLEQKFPLQRHLLDAFDLRVAVPRVTLLPDRDRIALDLDLDLGEQRSGRRFPMRVGLDSALRYDESATAVTLADVEVRTLSFDTVPEAWAPLLRRVLEPLVQQSLEGVAVHRFTPQQVQSARDQGLKPGPIRVTPGGVEMALQPAP